MTQIKGQKPTPSRSHFIRHARNFFNLLNAGNVAFVSLHPGSVSLQLRELVRIDFLVGCDDGEGHQDVGGGQRGATKVLSVVRRRGQLRLQEAEVRGEVVVQVHVVDFVGDAAGYGLDEEGDGRVADVCVAVSMHEL